MACNVCYAEASFKSFEEVKKEIHECESLLKQDLPFKEKGDAYYKLALACFQDQDLDKAFFYFLQSLEALRQTGSLPASFAEGEEKIYNEAYSLYLENSGGDPSLSGKKLLDAYSEIGCAHPEYLHLHFLLSTAYGNLGMYDLFFKSFYKTYPYFADTFLALKTKGVLHLRVARHFTSLEERANEEKKAIDYLVRAQRENPKDPGVYKVLIFLAKEVGNEQLIRSYLEKMVESDTVIPRSDIYLFVKEALVLENRPLAESIIGLAKKHYPYSRAISAAEDLLKGDSNGR